MGMHRCTTAECPYVGQPAPKGCGCHITDEQVLRNRVVELEADNTYLAKTLLEMGEKVVLYVDELEDEGDRVYFASTNHAEYLRDLRQEMDDLWFERETVEMAVKGRDLFADLRAVRSCKRALEESLRETLQVLAYVRAGDGSLPLSGPKTIEAATAALAKAGEVA